MLAPDLHRLLAALSLLAVAAVAIEGGVRAARGTPPSRWASRTFDVLLILLAMTAAAGLALLLSGHRPRELLHLVYAVLAVGAVPLADSLSARRAPRGRALGRLASGTVGAAVILRLMATG